MKTKSDLTEVMAVDEVPSAFLCRLGTVFAVFDQQDSGNISYGVECEGRRYFVKTAGRPDDDAHYLNHKQRLSLLENAIVLSRSCPHPALPRLLHIIPHSPHGMMLVYEWVTGELIGVAHADRDNLKSAYCRFRELSIQNIVDALSVIIDVHRDLELENWVAADLYDGCLIYDFDHHTLRVIDLDTYNRGSFTNTMGRMFGSTRFMAPEEFKLGARIDSRTTVFTLGRMVSVFLSDGTLEREQFRGTDRLYNVMRRACQNDPEARHGSVGAFWEEWKSGIANPSGA